MERKIYIFTSTNRAVSYGIGTYLEQLIISLKQLFINFDIINLHSEGDEATCTEKNGYRLISIPEISSLNSIKRFKYYYRNAVYILKEFITEEDEQLIFHLNFMNNKDLVISLKEMFDCKIMVTVHYTNWSFNLLGNYERLKELLGKNENELSGGIEVDTVKQVYEDSEMLKRCDYVVSVAQHSFDAIKEINKVETEKMRVINNGLLDDYIKFNPTKKKSIREKYFIANHTKILLFAGRLDDVKGLHYLINAFKVVLKEHPDCHLFIAGEGSYHKWISEIGYCGAKISFVGRLDKQRLYEFYSIADMGVVCSIHEEFGFVAIEMMMHELPIIVTDTGGLAEIVVNHISGLKVPVKTINHEKAIDIQMLVKQIRYLIGNPIAAKQLGRNGRKRFLEKYELCHFKENILNLYQSI